VPWFRPGFKRWWHVVVGAYVLGAFALSQYWLITDAPLARWLIEVIGDRHGTQIRYSGMTVGIAMFTVLLMPMVVLRFALRHRIRVVDPEAPQAPPRAIVRR
jgi:hypothetical protein